MPAVCGEAIDVPEITAKPFPVPTPAEKMLTPGAVTSGLSQLSPVRGPPEVKLAGARKPGLAMVERGQRGGAAVRRDQRRAVARLHAEERDRDVELLAGVRVAGDRALERRQRVGVVHHEHRGRAGLLAEDGPGHPGAGAAGGHRRARR